MRFGDLDVPVPGFGAMGISFALGNDLSYEQAEPVLLKALEQGCTFWDTAVRLYYPGLQGCALMNPPTDQRLGVLWAWQERKDYW